jgi:restriction endonuclease Mrr
MALSQLARDEMRAELLKLRSEITKMDADAAEALKQRNEKAVLADAYQKIIGEDLSAPNSGTEATNAPPQNTQIDPASLVSSLLTVLKNMHVPTKAAAVTKVLRNAGFEATGKTSLNTRVNSELYRLYKRGLIQRTTEGYFAQTHQ